MIQNYLRRRRRTSELDSLFRALTALYAPRAATVWIWKALCEETLLPYTIGDLIAQTLQYKNKGNSHYQDILPEETFRPGVLTYEYLIHTYSF